jgi:hypothetical protein
MGNTGLDGSVQVARVDLNDPVHSREIDTDTAAQGEDMTFQPGASAKRNNRDFVLGTNFYDLADVRDRLGEGDRIRGMSLMVRSVFAMLLTH